MPSKSIATFLREENGGATIEYLILAGAISTVVLAASQDYKASLIRLLDYVTDSLNDLSFASLN